MARGKYCDSVKEFSKLHFATRLLAAMSSELGGVATGGRKLPLSSSPQLASTPKLSAIAKEKTVNLVVFIMFNV